MPQLDFYSQTLHKVGLYYRIKYDFVGVYRHVTYIFSDKFKIWSPWNVKKHQLRMFLADWVGIWMTEICLWR